MADHADIDLPALGRYLEAHVPNFHGLNSLEKFSDGQSNPTFRLRADSGQYVLRRKPPGELLKSAHAVDREYRVQNALFKTDVPVAKTFHLCTDESVIGSIFYVMEYVQGRVFWNPELPELSRTERGEIYDAMNRTLVSIHSVDLEAAGLTDFGKPGNYYERQFSRWVGQYRATETEHISAMERVISWLDKNMVDDDGRYTLVHGDFRLDNLMMHPKKSEVIAVMDWELSTLGHPFADLAYQCMLWRMPSNPLLGGLEGVDRAALGVPTEEEYISRYCDRMEIKSVDYWVFYLVFGFFRIAAIAQGVKKRALMGNASSDRAMEIGNMVEPLSEKGCEVLKELG